MAADENDEGEDKENLAKELEEAALNSAGKNAGPIDRATELFTLMALPTTAYFFWDGNIPFTQEMAVIGFLVPLSFIGGIVSGTKAKGPAKDEKPVEAEKAA
ncbi:MAG: hypothetical protein J0L93_02975 [Deltaproteobacteria bacterium]|nr:hypothetical protein [Deltaproteobacteria bacterium]